MSNQLTVQQVRKLAAEAQVDPRTITRIYSGLSSKSSIRERVEEAARKLKIPIPK